MLLYEQDPEEQLFCLLVWVQGSAMRRLREARVPVLPLVLAAAGILFLGQHYLNQPLHLSVASLSPAAPPPELHIKKVALLFLTKGEMPHEATWRAWFKAAAGLMPREDAMRLCERPPPWWTALHTACDRMADGRDQLAKQALFSVYVHAPPSFEGGVRHALQIA